MVYIAMTDSTTTSSSSSSSSSSTLVVVITLYYEKQVGRDVKSIIDFQLIAIIIDLHNYCNFNY